MASPNEKLAAVPDGVRHLKKTKWPDGGRRHPSRAVFPEAVDGSCGFQSRPGSAQQ